MRFLKILGSDFLHESRNERELEVVRELGYDIYVLGRKTDNNHLFSIPNVVGIWKSVDPLYPLIKNKALNRAFCLIPWAIEARKVKADVISCHDITYLFVGWLSTLCMRKKPKLVYDSHEFEYERADKRGKLLKGIIKALECFLMKRCAFSMMVNDTIADSVQQLHHLESRPVVIRNIPEKCNLNIDEIRTVRKDFLNKRNLSDDTFICMYHGIVVEGRGIENSIKAMTEVSDGILIILGNGPLSMLEKLKEIAIREGVEDRVFFHQAVNKDVLFKYVAMADVGLVLIQGICKSYYYSLPNKLFENIQSLTPVIGSNFPEIKKIVCGYEVGEVVEPENISQIAEAINKMRNNKSYYQRLKNNLVRAKDELCWENESAVLKKEYLKI